MRLKLLFLGSKVELLLLLLHQIAVNCIPQDFLQQRRNYQGFINQQQQGFTRNGPVLFPENTSPPPRNPLVVTSRPLVDQIARSDLRAPTAQPNVEYEPKSRVVYSNYFSQRGQDYADYGYNGPLAVPDYGVIQSVGALQQANLAFAKNQTGPFDKHPYVGVSKKLKPYDPNYGRKYTSLERQTVLPPIYNALDNYAKTKVLKNKKKSNKKTYKNRKNENSVSNDGEEDEYYNDNSGNEAKQYAFSYAVRDRQTGDDFSHSQRHTGSATNGEYRVKLPDGRLQIVSYTADNGGYKAEVRYEEDPDAAKPSAVQHPEELQPYQHQVITTPATTIQESIETGKLGRIVVPNHEYQDYEIEYVNYYDQESSSREPPKEVLITSKPAYSVQTSTEPNLLYKQLIYHDKDGVKSTVYLVSTPQPVFGSKDPYYDPVKFVSSTPRYEGSDNSIAPTPSERLEAQRVHFVASTTPATPVYDVSTKSNSGQSKYTSIAPFLYRKPTTATPVQQVESGKATSPYYVTPTPFGGVDFKKYFAFSKR